jgi:hypothetical protein
MMFYQKVDLFMFLLLTKNELQTNVPYALLKNFMDKNPNVDLDGFVSVLLDQLPYNNPVEGDRVFLVETIYTEYNIGESAGK